MLYVANWKCNLSSALILDFLKNFNVLYTSYNKNVGRDRIIISPPFPYIPILTSYKPEYFTVAAQNITHLDDIGPTGEVSGNMLNDLGVKYVIIGHSERRQYFDESSEILEKKIRHAIASGLGIIFCVGESYEERCTSTHLEALSDQLQVILRCYDSNSCNSLMIAYEPVWAIGTGKNAGNAEIAEALSLLRNHMRSNFSNEAVESIKLLYGGSVSPSNISSLKKISDLDGFLIGSASLNPISFCDILFS